MVRVQTSSLLRDVFTITQAGEMIQPTEWLRVIEREGRGILLYILPLGTRHIATALDRLRNNASLHERGLSASTSELGPTPIRDIGLGSQVLLQLGVRSIRLLTNYPRRLAALEGYGIQVVDCVSSEIPADPPAAK
jgi:3,4-dihydroxy 2-butanone 4-phosphate synthase/GTP cyclohydrolase II